MAGFGWGQKVYVEKVYVLFPSLILGGGGVRVRVPYDQKQEKFHQKWLGEGARRVSRSLNRCPLRVFCTGATPELSCF